MKKYTSIIISSVLCLIIYHSCVEHPVESEILPLAENDALDDFWKYRLDDEGNPSTSPTDLLKLIGGEMNLCQADWDNDILWNNLGPHESFNGRQMNQGRIESITVNRNDENDIVIGSQNGGAWRTRDGGQTWTNTTDDEGFSLVGFHEIQRHPKDQKTLYAATGTAMDRWNNGQRGYGIGIVISTDGGETWNMTGHNPSFGAWRSETLDVAIDPRSTLDSTIVYTINESSVFRWTGSSLADGNWKLIYKDARQFSGPAIYGGVQNHDIEIDRFGNLYLCNALGVYIYPVNRDSMTKIESIKVPEERSNEMDCKGKMRKNPLKVLFDLEINRQGHIGLLANYYYAKPYGGGCRITNKPYYYYISKDKGKSWTDPVKLRSSGYALPNLAMNLYNAQVFYYEGSGRQVMRSVDGGLTSKRLTINRNHVDVRNLLLTSSRYGDSLGLHDVVYAGNDGGIAKLSNGQYWEDITGYGIANTNYFGLGITESDNEYVFLGAQDGSANFYREGQWYTTAPGGDNGDCLIDPRDKFHVYQSANGTMQKGVVDSIRWRGRSIKSLVKGAGLFPMMMNPNDPDEIFAGGKILFHSLNQGRSWTALENKHSSKRINKIAMSKSDPNIIYYVTNGFFWNTKSKASDAENQGGIYKGVRQVDGLWVVTDVSNNIRLKCKGDDNCGLPQTLSSVAVDPENADRLWVTMSGFADGKKVFYSENGGKKWDNISNCIPNLPAVAIAYEEGSDDGLYIGTDYGVFYKNAEMEDWIYYAANGPKSMITDMEINSTSGELFVSTLGRGLWKVMLADY